MKLGKIQEFTAATLLGVGIFSGTSAFIDNNEAVRAKAMATVLEAQGYPQAAELQAYADDREGWRNLFLSVAAIELGAAAVMGAAAGSRRREQEPQLDTSEQQ